MVMVRLSVSIPLANAAVPVRERVAVWNRLLQAEGRFCWSAIIFTILPSTQVVSICQVPSSVPPQFGFILQLPGAPPPLPPPPPHAQITVAEKAKETRAALVFVMCVMRTRKLKGGNGLESQGGHDHTRPGCPTQALDPEEGAPLGTHTLEVDCTCQ